MKYGTAVNLSKAGCPLIGCTTRRLVKEATKRPTIQGQAPPAALCESDKDKSTLSLWHQGPVVQSISATTFWEKVFAFRYLSHKMDLISTKLIRISLSFKGKIDYKMFVMIIDYISPNGRECAAFQSPWWNCIDLLGRERAILVLQGTWLPTYAVDLYTLLIADPDSSPNPSLKWWDGGRKQSPCYQNNHDEGPLLTCHPTLHPWVAERVQG